ncbi:calcium-transporting ATPase [Rozella allomycis CSF55]|uniref:Calcium-transporting ATPase n=1 Tax=Rozella allomycis (strain CSF55) TaxID=988480 RepID=A0A4P9YMR3_ROZAC|nr:calcium-transporting ATPase [Rozella allomycis CSF55]
MDCSYTQPTESVLSYFHVRVEEGLSEKQVLENRERYGRNELAHEEGTPLWKLVLEQFEDELVRVLLAAAAVSFAMAMAEEAEDRFHALVEPFVILLILICNAVVGVVQESNAEKAIEALKKYAPDSAKVRRGGLLEKIATEELVPGDIVEVSVGDKIPADMRIVEIKSSAFKVDQAILTGESVSVPKGVEEVREENAVIQEQVNMMFSGTTVTFGKAVGVVVKTGMNTCIGCIQQDISMQINEKTPLKRKLDEFGDSLAKVISVICILVWVINIGHFNDAVHGGFLKGAVYYFKIAVALAVAAIPEGLAVVITTCLALGTRAMAKKNAIVRSLPSVETLGCTSVICSDKTGTLTTNQMCVTRMMIVDEDDKFKEYKISGTSYSVKGEIEVVGGKEEYRMNEAIKEIAEICTMCNDSSVVYEEESGMYRAIGEPTEAALRVLVEKVKSESEKVNGSVSVEEDENEKIKIMRSYYENKFKKLITLDFDRDRKSMSVFVEEKKKKKKYILVKGAPESILERSSFYRTRDGETIKMSREMKERIMNKVFEYGDKEALRVLALGCVDEPSSFEDYDFEDSSKFVKYETRITFVGLIGMMDPPRPEVKESIKKCYSAGIRVIVITGDNKNTAESICKQIGIIKEREENVCYTGKEFDLMSLEEQEEIMKTAKLFSRTEPSHKLKIVELLQQMGHVVAMTGDGVNDAPALKKADIGVSMGSGTDVAKLASDMVLSDDNFSSIVSAVEQGRSIYANTKQFIRYLISSNIGEVVSIFLTVLLSLPEALIPVQLLWVNLVTDGLPATALGFNPPDHDIMKQPPRNANEPIVGRWLFIRYCIIGFYVGVATIAGYVWHYLFNPNGPLISWSDLTSHHSCSLSSAGCSIFQGFHSTKASTMSLSVLVTIEMFNALNSLSENESLLTLPFWSNLYLLLAICLSMLLHFAILYIPWLASLFSISSLDYNEWYAVILISAPVILIDEILKFFSRIKSSKIKQD